MTPPIQLIFSDELKLLSILDDNHSFSLDHSETQRHIPCSDALFLNDLFPLKTYFAQAQRVSDLYPLVNEQRSQ